MFSGLGNSLLTREGKYSNTPGYKCNKKDILTQYGTACTQLIDLVTYVEPVISKLEKNIILFFNRNGQNMVQSDMLKKTSTGYK